MRRLILISILILTLHSCNTKIELKSKFGLEYYYIGGAGYSGRGAEFDYYYITIVR
jgi:hypothetical protein